MRLKNIARLINRFTAVVHFLVAFALITKSSFSSRFVEDATFGILSPISLAVLLAIAGLIWLKWPMRQSLLVWASIPILILVSANTAYLITMRGQPLWPPVLYYGYGLTLLSVNWYYFLEAPALVTTPTSSNTEPGSK